ncbi:MAG TPA: type II toxin-antitoxin system HicB family antitoxin [Bryobacteraceae bacterium]|nr:type II toxin-antitoxin system HicB family antitoxin [Bryobacteraceae bacterium]
MIRYPIEIKREGRAYLASFPDVPIAHTAGKTREECLRYALEALETAFAAMMSDREEIPAPSRLRRGRDAVILPTLSEVKISLYRAMRKAGIRKADLARKLGWHKPQVDRLLDLRHESRLDQIEEAFIALGKQIHVVVEDAA